MKTIRLFEIIGTICCFICIVSWKFVSRDNTTKFVLLENTSTSVSETFTNSDINENEVMDGWLKESITEQAVACKLGFSEIKGKEEYWEATGTYIQIWEFPALGIHLEMESDSPGGNKKVRSVTMIEPCKFATSKGIRIGSEEKEVREKYMKSINDAYSDKNNIVVGSIYGGTIFTLTDGLVSKIFTGAAVE